MKIIISCGFPYQKGDNFVHAEQQDGDCFVSKELLESVEKYLLQSEGIVRVHHDNSSVYSSDDPKDKEVK